MKRTLLEDSDHQFKRIKIIKSWAIISDLHFTRSQLEKLSVSCQWIIEELLKEAHLKHIFILGDSLHVRSSIDSEANYAISEFFKRLLAISLQIQVHILIGNHDMNQKSCRKIHSLKAFTLEQAHSRLHIYEEITLLQLEDDVPVLMIPYHDDQTLIIEYLKKDLIKVLPENKWQNLILMGHMSINGAVMNGYQLPNKTSTITYQSGPLQMSTFNGFQCTFSGHFHKHKIYKIKNNPDINNPLKGSVTYVGSPLQLSSREVNETQKGMIIYDPNTNNFVLKVNPYGIHYLKATAKEWKDEIEAIDYNKDNILPPKTEWKEKSIIIIEDKIISSEEIQEISNVLHNQFFVKEVSLTKKKKQNIKNPFIVGGREVKEEKDENDVINEPLPVQDHESFLQQMLRYTDEYIEMAQPDPSILLVREYMYRVIQEVHEKKLEIQEDKPMMVVQDAQTVCSNLGRTFNMLSVEMYHFMQIGGKTTIHFDRMPKGLWWVTGPNGSGKSSIIEAIVWCLYGSLIRGDTGVEDVKYDPLSVSRLNQVQNVTIENQNKKPTKLSAGNVTTWVKLTLQSANMGLVTIYRERHKTKTGGTVLKIILGNEPHEQIIQKDSVASTQQYLQQNVLAGLDQHQFLRIFALSSSSTANFINASEAEKRDTISRLLGFDVLDSYKDKWKCIEKDQLVFKQTLTKQFDELTFKASYEQKKYQELKQDLIKMNQQQEKANELKQERLMKQKEKQELLKQQLEEKMKEYMTTTEEKLNKTQQEQAKMKEINHLKQQLQNNHQKLIQELIERKQQLEKQKQQYTLLDIVEISKLKEQQLEIYKQNQLQKQKENTNELFESLNEEIKKQRLKKQEENTKLQQEIDKELAQLKKLKDQEKLQVNNLVIRKQKLVVLEASTVDVNATILNMGKKLKDMNHLKQISLECLLFQGQDDEDGKYEGLYHAAKKSDELNQQQIPLLYTKIIDPEGKQQCELIQKTLHEKIREPIVLFLKRTNEEINNNGSIQRKNQHVELKKQIQLLNHQLFPSSVGSMVLSIQELDTQILKLQHKITTYEELQQYHLELTKLNLDQQEIKQKTEYIQKGEQRKLELDQSIQNYIQQATKQLEINEETQKQQYEDSCKLKAKEIQDTINLGEERKTQLLQLVQNDIKLLQIQLKNTQDTVAVCNLSKQEELQIQKKIEQRELQKTNLIHQINDEIEQTKMELESINNGIEHVDSTFKEEYSSLEHIIHNYTEKQVELEQEMQNTQQLIEKINEQLKEALQLQKTTNFWLQALSSHKHRMTNQFRSFCMAKEIGILNVALKKTHLYLNQTPNDKEKDQEDEDTIIIHKQTDEDIIFPCCYIDPDSLQVKETVTHHSLGKKSSGQLRRVQLALFFTLYQLCRKRSCLKSNFLFLDEPFDHLDTTGQVCLIKWVQNYQQSNEAPSHIFILTQNSIVQSNNAQFEEETHQINVTIEKASTRYTICKPDVNMHIIEQ